MTRRFVLLVLIFGLTLFSCTRKESVPDDIISQEKMGEIFVDLSMAEAFVENFRSRDTAVVKDSLIQLEFDKILAIHKVDEKKFVESYRFYKSHPTLFKMLTDSAYNRSLKFRDTSLLKKLPVHL